MTVAGTAGGKAAPDVTGSPKYKTYILIEYMCATHANTGLLDHVNRIVKNNRILITHLSSCTSGPRKIS